MQFEIANSIQEIINAIDSALALMNRLYDDSNLKASGEDGVLLSETKKRFKIYFDYFSRIVAIEKILGLVFEPKYLKDISYENQKDIYFYQNGIALKRAHLAFPQGRVHTKSQKPKHNSMGVPLRG